MLNAVFRIQSPKDLQQVIRFISGNIDDSIIRESTYWPVGILSCSDRVGFSKLADGGAWDDVVNYYFECIKCKSLYNLSAETYHGSGGSWSPETRETSLYRLHHRFKKIGEFFRF